VSVGDTGTLGVCPDSQGLGFDVKDVLPADEPEEQRSASKEDCPLFGMTGTKA